MVRRVQRGLDATAMTRGHLGQVVDVEETGLTGLVVTHSRLPADPSAQEVVIEELAAVAIGVDDGGRDIDTDQADDLRRNPGLFPNLSKDGLVRSLPRLDDSADRCPCSGVGTFDEQNLGSAWPLAQHDRTTTGQPQRVMTDVTSEVNDELRCRHDRQASGRVSRGRGSTTASRRIRDGNPGNPSRSCHHTGPLPSDLPGVPRDVDTALSEPEDVDSDHGRTLTL